MRTIQRLTALEILDSRGRPTVQAECLLTSGVTGSASVPSGASRGSAEALELRDGDIKRYRGLGCLKAVAHIHHEIHAALAGKDFSSQAELDRTLLNLDGTPNKSRLGANAILAVSLAFARAAAAEQNIPLYAGFAAMLDGVPPAMPRPVINLFSGGKHAGGQIPIQDVMISPERITDVMAMAVEVFQCAAEIVHERYAMRLLRADEGGLAPPFESIEAMFETAIQAIERAGLKPGSDVAIAVDVAASQFYRDGYYFLSEQPLSGAAMVEQIRQWVGAYELISVEDGLAEDDWQHWTLFHEAAGSQVQIVGDDLLCTNPARIRQAIASNAANTLLLKVNQIGTLTEAAEACRLARSAGWKIMVSARSGETEDHWLADLAFGWAGSQIKIGSVTQSERLAKYNRLLAIEAETRK